MISVTFSRASLTLIKGRPSAGFASSDITVVPIGKALQTGTLGLGEALDDTRATLAFESGVPTWKEAQQALEVRLGRTRWMTAMVRCCLF